MKSENISRCARPYIKKAIGTETKNGSLVINTADYRVCSFGLGRRQQTALKMASSKPSILFENNVIR